MAQESESILYTIEDQSAQSAANRSRQFMDSVPRVCSLSRLLAAAAVLHILLALTLFIAARTQVASNLIDRSGIVNSFASDGAKYQPRAIELVEILKQQGIKAWLTEGAPANVKLLSLEFVALGPLFGYSTLSAEPLNLISYLAIISLTFLIAMEFGSRRAALICAGLVALWPTLLLHTLQLLKDPLFIAGALALILCVTTWLTRFYTSAMAGWVTGLLVGVILTLLLIRFDFALIIVALALLGFAFLLVRQMIERRWLVLNTASSTVVVLVTVAVIVVIVNSHDKKQHVIEAIKNYPSNVIGVLKSVATDRIRLPTVVTLARRDQSGNPTGAEQFADRLAAGVGDIRSRFILFDSDSGSSIDGEVQVNNFKSLVLYAPRALEIGSFAPFPNRWFEAGKRVGRTGRLISGIETFGFYVLEMVAAVGMISDRRSLARWWLVFVVMFGVTAIALVVPNVGALYRFRYTFWIVVLILGVTGLENIFAEWIRRPSNRRAAGKTISVASALTRQLSVGFACVLVAMSALSCSRPSAESRATLVSSAQKQIAAALLSSAPRSVTIVNSTGATIHTVFLSPSDSQDWQENILGMNYFDNGDSLKVAINGNASDVAWDLRIEDRDRHYAEWKGMHINNISTITLRVEVREKATVIAQVE